MLDPIDDRRVRERVDAHPHRLIFASLSGAHLYGFPSHDSDVDVRGVHVLPIEEVIGLNPQPDTYDDMVIINGLEIDLVTFDLKKFCALLLKRNGNVLEQLVSPHVLRSSPRHEQLREIAPRCVTRHHVHHYRGMVQNRAKAFAETGGLKPLLYAIRAALTGIHLMNTGEVEANLSALIDRYSRPDVEELIIRKREGERVNLERSAQPFWTSEITRLLVQLEEAFEASKLPEAPDCGAELDAFLIQCRIEEQ